MTGYKIYESALLKLGYHDSKGTIEQVIPFKKIALDAINEISFDICGAEPIDTLFEEVNLDKQAISVLSYGVAMIISQYNHDTEKNIIMTALFNARRAAFLSDSKRITDVSPEIYGV
ncbi:MAG: hypothetical protein MJ090_00310 [Clostridia bacterium]|nr:hypothetical protein [Clostridia bacterium]